MSGGRTSLLDFRHVDLLCPTEREARLTLNDYDSGLSSVAWNLLQRTQARRVFLTLEKRGLIVFDRPTQERESPEWGGRLRSELLPSFVDQPVDFLGCGDALLAASTLALASDAPLMNAAYLGNAAAAVEASMLGNQPVEAARLHDMIRVRREWQTSAVSAVASSAPPLLRSGAPTASPAVPVR